MPTSTLETQSMEYKESWQDDCLRTICAFANAEGGVLEIGKNDHGEIIGLSNMTIFKRLQPTETFFFFNAASLLLIFAHIIIFIGFTIVGYLI